MTDPQDRINRAARAKAILETEMIRDAFDALRGEYTKAWQISALVDRETREANYLRLRALDEFRGHFAKIMSDGELAQADINAIQRTPRRLA